MLTVESEATDELTITNVSDKTQTITLQEPPVVHKYAFQICPVTASLKTVSLFFAFRLTFQGDSCTFAFLITPKCTGNIHFQVPVQISGFTYLYFVV